MNAATRFYSVMTHYLPFFQDPVLAFPFRYLALLGPCPAQPRALAAVLTQKRKDYLDLAAVLLRKYPCTSTERACSFLLSLCNNDPPQPVPRLNWFESPPDVGPSIDVGLPHALGRIAPVMRFNAQLRR